MKRLFISFAVIVLLVSLALAQQPLWNAYEWYYEPTTASDTDLTITHGGRTPYVLGHASWYFEVKQLREAVMDFDTMGDSLQIAIWASSGFLDENNAQVWDSIAAFAIKDSVLANWPAHITLVGSDSVWQYREVKIRVRWKMSYYWDTDTAFATSPLYRMRLATRYD